MGISTSFKDVLIRRFLLEQLRSGNVPSATDIEEYVLAFEAEHPDYREPSLYDLDLKISHHSVSSASSFKEFTNTLEKDLEVGNQALVDTLQESFDSYDRWQIELENLRTRASKLRDRVDALLLLRSDTAGFFDAFDEDFYTTEFIDETTTTAAVDAGDGKVTLGLVRPDTPSSLYKIDLNDIKLEDISFIPTSSLGYLGLKVDELLPITNMVKDTTKGWSCFVISTFGTRPVTTELKIKLSGSDLVELNRIRVDLGTASVSGGLLFTGQYSPDGFTWSLLPTDFHTKKISIKDDFTFPTVRARYVKFLIVNDSPDIIVSSQYLYDFSIRNLSFYHETYENFASRADVVASKDIVFKDTSGSPREISKVTLEVCEEIVPETDILYQVRGYDNDLMSWTAWNDIAPFNREVPDRSVVVQLASDLPILSTDGTQATRLNESVDIRKINFSRIKTSTGLVLNYDCFRESIVPLNFHLSSANFVARNERSLKVPRNLGLQEFKFPYLPQDLTVRGVATGWRISEDESSYECLFEVDSSDGMTLDFGESRAYLDSTRVTGRVLVSKGLHHFRTQITNWKSLASAIVPTTLAELRSLDTLYPYNHKYIIEGYKYPSLWDHERAYVGVDRYFSHLCKEVSSLELKRSYGSERLDLLATDQLSSSSPDSGEGIFLVNYDPFYSDFSNEIFSVYTTVRDNRVDKLQWRAVLKSNDSSRSPVLSFVRLKVG